MSTMITAAFRIMLLMKVKTAAISFLLKCSQQKAIFLMSTYIERTLFPLIKRKQANKHCQKEASK